MNITYTVDDRDPNKMYCITCGKETEVCYTDEGVLGLSHGMCECKECYSKTHPLCPKCDDLTDPMWKYCAHCGIKLGKI